MTDDLLINCVPIRITDNEATVYVSKVPKDDFRKVSWGTITGIRGDHDELRYWSPEIAPNADPQEISSSKQPSLFRYLLNDELFNHFKNSGYLITRSFLGGTEVWIKAQTSSIPGTTAHRVFTMRVLSAKDQHATSGWTMQVTYAGERVTRPKSIGDIEIPSALVRKFVYDNQIYRTSKYAKPLPIQMDVVIDREIAAAIGVTWKRRKNTNKYKTFFSEVSSFYEQHLKGKQIGTAIQVLEAGFGRVTESQVWRTPVDSNLLEFGNGHTHFNAYMGLKEFGPFAGPAVSDYKFFFIFHESSRDHANKLYQYFNRGYKGYPGLASFVAIDLALDKERTIIFENLDSPSIEILDALAKMTFDEGITYQAIYLTPISRDEPDNEKHADYFKVKEALLERNIGSQVIFRENIDVANFNFSLPNISIALLAKLGGRPWRLNRPIETELIIGIGAYRQDDNRFLGTTFSFRNDGTFIGFDAANYPDINQLGQFFERAVRSFVSEEISVSQVVIHFYKKMNREEERELTAALDRLDLQVPYVVITIADERQYDYVVFDPGFSGVMPLSGTCVKLRHGEFLLSNNTRYRKRTGARIDDYPFPLKISISKSNLSSIDDSMTRKLIDQVYQFSRMYWRSVKQRAMPVTILYSQKIAQMAANFPDRSVPNTHVAKRTLWFL